MKAWKLGVGLLLSVLLLVCLFPAAYADELTDLQEALDSFIQTGSPIGYTLNGAVVSRESDFTIPGGFSLTIGDGGRLVCDDFTIASGGRVLLDGGSLTSWADAIKLDGELKLQRGMLSCGAASFDALKAAQKAGRLTFNGDEWRIGTFDAVYDEAAIPAAITRARDIMAYFGDRNAAATVQTWCDWTIPAGSAVDVGSATVEIDQKLTVQGALTARQFNMHPGSELLVDGGTVTVMGAEGMFQPFNTGGSITLRNGGEINTAFGSFAGSNGRGLRDAANTNKLIFEDADSHVNFSYMVYISDFLDLDDLLSGTHEIYNTLRREHTSVSMRLMDNWTVGAEYSGENYLELNQIAVEVKAGKTLTVNGELRTKRLTADEGSFVVVVGGTEKNAKLHAKTLVPNGDFTLRNGEISADAENLEAFAAAEKAGRVHYEGSYAVVKLQYDVSDGESAAEAILAGTNACLRGGERNENRAFDVDVRNCDWTVSGAVTLPEYGYLALRNCDVTVPEGASLIVLSDFDIAQDASLTVNGTLEAREFGCIRVHGSLRNNGELRLTRDFWSTGVLDIDSEIGGRYVGADGSCILVEGAADYADDYILGVNRNQFSREEIQLDGKAFVLYTRNPAIFTAFKSYCEGESDALPALNGIDSLTLTDSVTLAAGREADLSGLTLIVPPGVTLTVNGGLTLGDFTIQQGGAVTLGDTGAMTLTKWQALSNHIWDGWRADFKAGRLVFRDENAGFTLMRGGLRSPDDLKRALSDAADYVNEGAGHLTFNALTAGAIDASAETLCIPLGMTLTLNDKLTVGDFEITQNYQAGQRGDVVISATGELHVTKWLELSNNLWTIWQSRGETDRITFDTDAGFLLQRGPCALDADSLAFTLRDARQTISGNEHLGFAFGMPEAVMIDGEPYPLTIEALDYRIEIPERVLFDIGGTLITGSFVDYGMVNVGENGFLYAQDLFRIGENVTEGMFILNGTLSVEHTALIPEQLAVLTLGENSLIDVSFNCYEPEDIVTELNNPTALFPHFRRSVWVLCDWELGEDLTLPGQLRLCLANEYGHLASLTVPAGLRLTVPADSGIYARDGVPFLVNGALVNNGEINLGENWRVTDITLGEKGVYAGSGTLTAGGEAYEVRNDPSHADLILPASLTELESESFANGGFRTVYIPASAEKPVTVAADAFGKAEDLIVLGRPGTSAEAFAESKGFPFAPVE